MLLSLAISAARDAELRDQLQRGAPGERGRTLEALLRELMPSLHALCVNTLGNRADADDALQEALVVIYRSIDGFRGDSKLSTWAYRITVRIAIRHGARRRRRATAELDDSLPAAGNALDTVRVKQLLDALSKLPAKHRVVLSLFAIEGLSHDEIADILGVPEGTVWSRLHTGRQALVSALGAEA